MAPPTWTTFLAFFSFFAMRLLGLSPITLSNTDGFTCSEKHGPISWFVDHIHLNLTSGYPISGSRFVGRRDSFSYGCNEFKTSDLLKLTDPPSLYALNVPSLILRLTVSAPIWRSRCTSSGLSSGSSSGIAGLVKRAARR